MKCFKATNTRHSAIMLLLMALMGSNISLAHAEPANLGRLFSTPEKRTLLERQRLSNIQETQTLEGSTMRLDGIVQRASGKSTVWINGRAQDEHEATRTGVKVFLSAQNPSRASLAPGEEAPTQLSVGEEINRATGERNDRLGGGKIVTPVTRR
ncbi:MAG: hypothetical protein RugAbin2_00788 [Rugosibacter sp.]|jgi:hypothetical protein|nr:hypothetical protein [Rugosibacter sp.]